jgi:HK97 gp10 family phage protein
MPVSFPGLGAFRDEMVGRVDRRVKALGVHIAGRAQENAPVRSGDLRRSIHNDADAPPLVARVVVGVPYGYWVEVGTSRTRAQPYLRPAFMEASRLWRALGNTELSFPNVPEPYTAMPERHGGYGRAQIRHRGALIARAR